MCITAEHLLLSPRVKNQNQFRERLETRLLCGYLWLLNITPVTDTHTHTHTHTQKGTRNSVVFVLSELCLFKGGLVCEAEALNNN